MFFVRFVERSIHRRCGVYLYGLEIDPGDGGAEVMKRKRALYSPQALTRSLKPANQRNKTGRYTQDG